MSDRNNLQIADQGEEAGLVLPLQGAAMSGDAARKSACATVANVF
jgi:hypothetical protein